MESYVYWIFDWCHVLSSNERNFQMKKKMVLNHIGPICMHFICKYRSLRSQCPMAWVFAIHKLLKNCYKDKNNLLWTSSPHYVPMPILIQRIYLKIQIVPYMYIVHHWYMFFFFFFFCKPNASLGTFQFHRYLLSGYL